MAYFSTDGITDPIELEATIQKAKDTYEKRIADRPDQWCALIYSGHWASRGYWVETKKQPLSKQDFIVKEYVP